MSLYAGISARHVNSYHQNNNFLFQFILAEFLEVCDEIQKLDALCSRSFAPLAANEQACRQKDLHLMQETLMHLMGSTKENMRLFCWDLNKGLISRLRTYCTLFLQNADTDEKELIAIQHYAEKIWQSCLQAIDALHELPQDHTSFFSALEKASAGTQRFAKLIARFIPQFKNDENVVFYVLRNHKRFDKIYGNKFTVKLFSKMYSKGLKEGHHFLAEKYTHRGFDKILPIIDSAVAELEACPS